MGFRAGSWRYDVGVTKGPLLYEGVASDQVCIQRTRQILIAADADANGRPRLLWRGLVQAWLFETGRPKTDAEWVDLFSCVAHAGVIDLNIHGGLPALISLQPGECLRPAAMRIGQSTNRQCAGCGGSVAGGSVSCTPIDFGVAEFRFFCEYCGKTMIWREATSADGRALAITFGKPRFEKGNTSGVEIDEAAGSDLCGFKSD